MVAIQPYSLSLITKFVQLIDEEDYVMIYRELICSLSQAVKIAMHYYSSSSTTLKPYQVSSQEKLNVYILEFSMMNMDSYQWFIHHPLKDLLLFLHSLHPALIQSFLQQYHYFYTLSFSAYTLGDLISPPFTPKNDHQEEAMMQLCSTIIHILPSSFEVFVSLNYLKTMLKQQEQYLQTWIEKTIFLPELLQKLMYYLLTIYTNFIQEENKEGQQYISECISCLGAIPSEKYTLTQETLSTYPIYETDINLCLKHIIPFCIEKIKGIPSIQSSTRLGFTIQSLLEYLYLNDPQNEDKSTLEKTTFPEYLNKVFSNEELSYISQFWYSKYQYTLLETKMRPMQDISIQYYHPWLCHMTRHLYTILRDQLKTGVPSGKEVQKNATVLLKCISLAHIPTATILHFLFPFYIVDALALLEKEASHPHGYTFDQFKEEWIEMVHRVALQLSQEQFQDVPSFNNTTASIGEILLYAFEVLSYWTSGTRDPMIYRNPNEGWRSFDPVVNERIKEFLSSISKEDKIRMAVSIGNYEFAIRYLSCPSLHIL